ncbi:hypothetical protein [Streptomyces sp. JB150]|uniref:hypothetical protein n=1 Tax=Streptomyces sp. JB150 TaxID=2714844 RepID=UPI001407498F|nr:hypothetical protein [Streptomyces sp. JB150]QIJ64459.1 hypothetical protein G7Z13_22445 [Streptomyces sp. JB150]
MPVEPTQDPFESRLGAALRETGDSFDTDRPALVSAGQARGRRMRVRRRAAVFGGTASLALVGVGVGATLLLPGSGSGGAGGQASVGREGNASASATASTTAGGAVTGEKMIATLKSLLPEGKVSDTAGQGTHEGPPPYVRAVFDDGRGPGAVTVTVDRLEPGSGTARQLTTCPDKLLVPYDACRTSRLPDGSMLLILQGYEYPDRRVDTKRWHAELVTPEGRHVSVAEWNAAAEKDAPVTRPEPPLGPLQLEEIATAPEWRAVADSIPKSPEGPKGAQKPTSAATSAPPAADGADIRDTLVRLLPKDVEVVSQGGQETEYAYVVVDDGEGRSLVQINVQPDMRDVADQLYGADAETLADGTKVTVRQGPGEKGGEGVVMWTVDTMRPDGRRVVISAFNSGAQHAAATRETPALTIGELREIALDPTWRTLS